VSSASLLKEERQARILDLLATSGRVVATELQDAFGVSGGHRGGRRGRLARRARDDVRRRIELVTA
jgi:hypothetical protein